jgi:DNA polymerase-1
LPIQGGAADLMLTAIPLGYRAFRQAGIRGGLIATVHDELVSEVCEDDAQRAAEIMHGEMVRAFEICFPGAPTTGLLKVDRGRNWKEAKDAKEEDSLSSDQPSAPQKLRRPIN